MNEFHPIVRPTVFRAVRRLLRTGPKRLARAAGLACFAVSAFVVIFYAAAMSPLGTWVAGTRASDLTYEDVVRDPDAARGKVVRWYLTNPGAKGVFYYRGEWDNPVALMGFKDITGTGQSGVPNAHLVVARVNGRDENGVILSYIGRR